MQHWEEWERKREGHGRWEKVYCYHELISAVCLGAFCFLSLLLFVCVQIVERKAYGFDRD